MIIKKYLNTTKTKVEDKAYNVFIGLSLGNKYFINEKNVQEFIAWTLKYSKNDIVVLIPDTIHAVNCEIRSGFSKSRACNYVKRKGEEIEALVHDVVNKHFFKQKNHISIIKFNTIENEDEYQRRKKILYEEFNNNSEFHNKIIEIVKESVNPAIIKLSVSDYERLCSYPLDELPFLISGFKYKKRIYDLVPYPGLSKIDYLIVDLQEGNTFPEITKKLKIKNKVAILEAYAS